MLKADDNEPKLFWVTSTQQPCVTVVVQMWVAVMLVSCVPMTLSSVYKEKALGETEIDVVYLNGSRLFCVFLFPCSHASLLQLGGCVSMHCDGGVCGACRLRAETRHHTGNASQCERSAGVLLVSRRWCCLVAYIVNGYHCWMGTTVDRNPMDKGNTGLCDQAPLFVNVYMCFNLLYNVFIILILKYGSSNILWLAMTLMVPLGNAAFALKVRRTKKTRR